MKVNRPASCGAVGFDPQNSRHGKYMSRPVNLRFYSSFPLVTIPSLLPYSNLKKFNAA